MDDIQKTGVVVEVEYYDEKFDQLFFDVTVCEADSGYLSIGHHLANKNEEGKSVFVLTNIDLKRIKQFSMFQSLDDFNGSKGIYPKPTWQNEGDIVPEWNVGKKYEIEVEYLDKDNKPDKILITNVTNASYIREVGLDMLRFKYILKNGHQSYWGIGLSKLVKWKVIREME